MIKVLAPSRNYEITKMQIEAGADEIYLGLQTGDFNVYSFGGRFKSMNGVQTQVADLDELKKVSRLCKKNNVTLQLTANMHYIPKELEEEYIAFIKTCMPYIDQVIVSNIGLIRKLKKHRIDTPIVAGSFTFIPNSEMVKYLQSLGVVRVVMPHAAKLDELAILKKRIPDMELEVFALIGGGNNCGRCMMFHSPIRCDIGPGCRASYDVRYNGKVFEKISFMDAAADCSLCSMKELIEAGVDSLKIVGRETKNEVVASLFTEVFVQYRKYLYEGMPKKDIKAHLSEELLGWDMIWGNRFCNNNKCKFQETNVTRSYV